MNRIVDFCAVFTVGCPVVLLGILGISSLLGRRLSEATSRRLTATVMTAMVLSSVFGCCLFLTSEVRPHVLSLGRWFIVGTEGFAADLSIDPLALVFAAVVATVCGVAAAFSTRYLHREPGYNRYFVQFAALTTGMSLVALAGSIEVLFAGWELVGLSSALLVAFFHERPAPVRNALHVFAVYRISDAAMLSAAVLLHHFAGTGSLSLLFGAVHGEAVRPLAAPVATAIALLLGLSVAAKSALLPFSGWLPRAMEGPTPSSAVYYGSLSVHAGCFLLLRATPLLEHSWIARVMIGTAGLCTALYATFAGRTQADVKSVLAFATLSQIGVIIVEISLGLSAVAFAHLTGHALFRLLQFLTAPNVIHEFHQLENVSGGHLGATGRHLERLVPQTWQPRLYRFALDRAGLDEVLERFVVAPIYSLAHALDRLDRSACGLLAGRLRIFQPRKPERKA